MSDENDKGNYPACCAPFASVFDDAAEVCVEFFEALLFGSLFAYFVLFDASCDVE